jgi:hypothetical protein
MVTISLSWSAVPGGIYTEIVTSVLAEGPKLTGEEERVVVQVCPEAARSKLSVTLPVFVTVSV